jgi:thiamine monophosphate kinase
VSTTSLKNLEKVKKNAKKIGLNLYEIGVVRNGKNVVIENNGKQYRMNDVGWLHFQ